MTASTNHVLKAVTLLFVIGSAVLIVRGCVREPPQLAGSKLSLPIEAVAPAEIAAEADTETETLRTLISEVRRLREDTAALETDNAALREQNAQLQRMEDRLATRLDAELESTESELAQRSERAERQSQDAARLFEGLERRLRELDPGSDARAAGSDLPVGLGYDDYLMTGVAGDAVIWFDPLDAPSPDTEGTRVFPDPIENLWHKVGGAPASDPADPLAPQPVYTVPRNATLVGARGFTALIGRIPVRGQVVDPFPFKVLVGPDNLAANGFEMPELAGMVFSGRAVGDWNLACVRGEVFSVTYVLADGSIQSYPQGNLQIQETEALGWISDPYGVPCIGGERKTNAESLLAQRIGLTTAAAAANAAAAAETATTVSGAMGTSTTAVTGDIGAFIRNRTITESLDEISSWLGERQAQSFDAIYVPPDSALVVHVTRELAIDHDPHGRKVNHHAQLESSARRFLD